MTRDDGWRFLSLGRHLERLLFVAATLGDVAPDRPPADPALLEWLLELSDSLLTYRARYMQPARVAGGRRPAAVRRAQPALGAVPAGEARQARAAAAGRRPRSTSLPDDRARSNDVPPPSTGAGRAVRRPTAARASCWTAASALALRLSDALTLRYFSHVYELPTRRRTGMMTRTPAITSSTRRATSTPAACPRRSTSPVSRRGRCRGRRVHQHELTRRAVARPTTSSGSTTSATRASVRDPDAVCRAARRQPQRRRSAAARAVGRSIRTRVRRGKTSASRRVSRAARRPTMPRSSAIRRRTSSRRRSWPPSRARRLPPDGRCSRRRST